MADRGHQASGSHVCDDLGEAIAPRWVSASTRGSRTAVERPLRKLVTTVSSCDPRDLALGDALAAERTYEVVDAAGRDALDVRLLDHGEQGPLRASARLEQSREVAALAQLRDMQLDGAGACVPAPWPVGLAALAVPAPTCAATSLTACTTQKVEVTPGRLLAQQLQQVPFVATNS